MPHTSTLSVPTTSGPTPEEQLRDSEIRLRLLLESARDHAILSTSPDRRVNYWSSGAERLFGYTEAQILGLSADLLFTSEDRAAAAPDKEMADALRHGRAEDERWHLRRDGTRFFASDILSPLRTPDAQLVGFVKIVRDLTERKLAEERLRAAHDSLERRVRERSVALDIANEELRAANEELRVLMEQHQQTDALRHEAVRRIESVQEDERRRISRELHDHLGQHVAALMLGLTSLEWEAPDRPARIKELLALTERIGHEIHTLAVQLRPTALDDLGLQGALASCVELWSRHSGVKVDLHSSNLEAPRLPAEMELALYRIVQEALTNVMKHAAAHVVSVIVERREGEVLVIVEDDGVGFESGELSAKSRGRLGLLGMDERATQFGGHVNVESAPGRGTTVFVRIPLQP